MIYFLDNSLQLQKIVTSKNVISAIHEHELNGLIRADVELDLSYANKFLVLGIDHVGYYYKDEFYLHKIQRVEYDHVNETATVVLRHIFFEDMIFGKLIQDVRPQNQDALTVSRQTIDANTRWQTIMTDVTGRLSTNFYWQVPYEVIEFMTENYRIEYLPKILFDGQNINGFQLHLANKIGEDKNIRIPYGSRVLDLKYEEDYSEIITKLVVHGKGEEVGDGYGRRINISDVNFSRNGVKSPVGSLYLEDESITNTYGNDGQTPREGREVFEDIEDVNELAEAGYQHYLQVSRPQMLFTADVADIGDVGIGDSVMIIRREYDVYFKARIHKLSVDLLYPEDAQVELGDYKHFKESKISRKSREKNNRIQRQLSDRITRLKQEANERFDNEVTQWKSEYEQALIDVHAEIEADRENMTNLIEGTRTEFTDNLNAEITQTKEYAEQQAQEKAEAVRTDLGAVTSGHQAMLDSLQDNVMSIDDFLGDKTVGLNELLLNERMLFEEKLNNVDTWHYNMLRGTRFDENRWTATFGEIRTDEDVPYYYFDPNATTSSLPYVQSTQEIVFEQGETYRLSFDWQTYAVRKVDYTYIIASPDDGGGNINIGIPTEQGSRIDGTNLFTSFGSEYGRYYIEFSPFRTIRGFIRIGSNLNNNENGRRAFKVRLPYLTTTENTRWLYHQLDSAQNIEEITRRVMLLEDGREELITRTEYDFSTGEIEGSLKSIIETVDESTLIMQNHENWILTNGASIERTVEGFDSKAWLTDIHNPNMIPHSAVQDIDSRLMWDLSLVNSTGSSYTDWMAARHTVAPRSYIGVRSPEFEVVAGESYVLTFESWENGNDSANTSGLMDYIFLVSSDAPNQTLWSLNNRKAIGTINGATIYRNEIKFTANSSTKTARVLIGTRVITQGQDSIFRFRQPKLEMGVQATPYNNAFSNITQRADNIMLAIQGIGEQGFLNQSDIVLRPDYVQIGSQQIDGDSIASLLRVSPTGIDIVADALRLSGDLYVDGDITALAVSAIEGNFARLFANQLTANVITSDHIQVGTQLVDKMFATAARIDQLITKTHFVNEINALTINAVEANISHVRGVLFQANIIEAEWLKSGTALLDRVFASTGMFERMMAKSGFVTTLSTITLDLHELTIWRPDGVAFVMNGMERFGHPVPVVRYIDDEVETDDKTYWTNSRGAQVVGIAYGDHAGRYYNLVVGMGLRWDSDYATQYCNVQIRTVNSPTGVNIPVFNKEITARRSEGLQWHTLSVPLGRPTYGAMTFQIEIFRRGDNVYAPVEMRYGRSWISA